MGPMRDSEIVEASHEPSLRPRPRFVLLVFDVSLRLKEFPSFQCTPLETGLAETFQELSSRA